jgi:very-short-patch-repair endonuclease
MPSKGYLARRFGPRITNAEWELRRALERVKIPFVTQELITTANGQFLVDFLIDGRIVVEVDGSSHYFGKHSRQKDAWKNHELKQAGYKVLRFRNIDVYKRLPQVISEIKRVLNGEKTETS